MTAPNGKVLTGSVVVLFCAFATAVAIRGQQSATTASLALPKLVVIDTHLQKTTALYHREECPWLHGGDRRFFTPPEAKKRFFQPHCKCMVGRDVNPDGCATEIDAAISVGESSPAPMSLAPAPIGRPATPSTPVETPARTAPRVQQTSQRCQALTKAGAQCKRNAQPGRSYCWQHP